MNSSRSTGRLLCWMPAAREVDRADAAIHRRVVVLASCGHLDDLRLDILRDLANFFDVVSGPGQFVERASGGDQQRRRPGNPCPCRSFRVRGKLNPRFRPEEPNDVSKQRKFVLFLADRKASKSSNISSAF